MSEEGSTDAPLIRHLGLVPYESTWRAMQRFTDERDAATRDEIWFLEHPPVFTLGLNASREHLIAPGEIPVVQIDRGGQVTYHGPGQLVIYPLSTSTACARCARIRRGARERRDRLRRRARAWRRAARGRRRGCTSMARNSRALVCASAAERVTTVWHSIFRWTCSPSIESTCAATPDLRPHASSTLRAPFAMSVPRPPGLHAASPAAASGQFAHSAISTDLQAVSSR